MINKYKIKMVQEELYNVRDLPRRGDEKNSRRDTVALQFVMILNSDWFLYKENLLGLGTYTRLGLLLYSTYLLVSY